MTTEETTLEYRRIPTQHGYDVYIPPGFRYTSGRAEATLAFVTAIEESTAQLVRSVIFNRDQRAPTTFYNIVVAFHGGKPRGNVTT